MGISAYQGFSRDIRCQQTPATEHILCLFLAWLRQMGLSADTAQVYLAGVRYLHLQHGMDLTAFQGHQIRAAMRGMQRLQRQPLTPRPPVTISQLRYFKDRALGNCALPYQDAQMLWMAISVAFFGLLRVSEYTCASASSFHPQRTLIRRNVTISDSILTLLLPMSKTDQLREGAAVSIRVTCTGDVLCPVSAMAAYSGQLRTA